MEGMKISAFSLGLNCLAALRDTVTGYEFKGIADSPKIHQEAASRFQFGNNVDLLGIFESLVSQVFVANTAWVFPTLPYLRTSPSLNFFKMEVCERADIKRCMYYGASLWVL
jgi:hypothetical protein